MAEFIFNGINGATGDYDLPPQTPESMARVARGIPLDKDEQRDIAIRRSLDQQQTEHFGIREGADPTDLGGKVDYQVGFRVGVELANRRLLGEVVVGTAGDDQLAGSGDDQCKEIDDPGPGTGNHLATHGAPAADPQPRRCQHHDDLLNPGKLRQEFRVSAEADAGFIDDDSYIFVMSRTDDIINVAGHRLSTGAMEEVLADHPDVAECAVLGVDDKLKGQVPIGFLVLNAGVTRDADDIIKETIQMVRDRIGPVASFKTATVVKRLPKTRSGKILRGTMRKIAEKEEYRMPANR